MVSEIEIPDMTPPKKQEIDKATFVAISTRSSQ
jgi:hypothetical protein